MVVRPSGSGQPNDYLDFFPSFYRSHRLSNAGSWFKKKDIHHFPGFQMMGSLRRRLTSKRNAIQVPSVYRSFDTDYDHLPVIAMLKMKLRHHGPKPTKTYRALNLHACRTTRLGGHLQLRSQAIYKLQAVCRVSQSMTHGANVTRLSLLRQRRSLATRTWWKS